MDKKQHRHSSLTVPSSCYPAPSQHSLPYPPRYRSTSLKNPINYTSEPPRPASLVRVKGQMAMNTPPPKSSDMAWANDQSSRRGTPGRPGTPRTPGTPQRAGTPDAGASSLVNPSSALLQDLLKEQRASRGTRGPASEDMEGQVPRTPDRPQSQAQSQSQDDGASERKRKVNSALSAGLRQPREMGVREMDQYVSKMNKQNFDLKLEIFHRAQQATALEKRLERMEESEEEVKRMRGLEDELQELRNAEEDNQRLRESNEQLRQELDKRDQAVTEAVELICELEARTDELEGGSRPSTSNGPDDATPKQRTTIDIPERTSSRRGILLGKHRPLSPESRHLQSAPSFLRDENKNTAVLRGLYIPSGDQSQSAMSVVTKSESLNSINEPTEPASPRLSALSECSDLLPEDVPVIQGGLDNPENTTETATASSDTLGLRHVEHGSKHGDIDINQWIQPLPDMFPTNAVRPPTRANRTSMFEFKSPINEGDMNMNDARQRVRLDGFFGASRLPPTPDTMSTAYAPRTNPSNGSIQAEKGQLEFMKQRLGRPRSFDDLASRRSSGNSGNTDSVDTNISEISRPGLGTNERDEAPANVPLNAVSYKHRRRATCQEPPPSWPGLDYCEGNNDKGMERVLSKMDNNHYSPDSTAPPSKRHTVNFTSSSPPLTPQDWVEAANSNPRSRKATPHTPQNYDTYSGPTSIDSGLLGARRPGQSAFHGRRHSMGSPFQELKPVPEPTLDLRSLEHAPQPALRPAPAPPSESTSRRRISFRPPFLSRLANPRRPQPSPVGDTGHSGGAPSPVVHKTRSMASRSPQVNENVERLGPSRAVPNTPIPTYADPRKQDNVHRTLPHSFTESNLWSSGTAPRPMTSTSKEHKRRSSLGLFGWMKEASGIGHSKKPEPTSPSGMRRRTSLRVAPDAPAIPETTPTGANSNVDEDELGRRPRYVERRARRV